MPLSRRNMLCSRCQNFNIQAFAKTGYPYRGYPVEAVITAAASGCSFCTLILDLLLEQSKAKKLAYLNIALADSSKQQIDVPSVSSQHFTLLCRRASAVCAPAWVHFGVLRDTSESASDDALEISELIVFVSRFPDMDHSKWQWARGRYTWPIYLHVAAEPDAPAHTSRDIVGTLNRGGNTSWSFTNINAIQRWQRACQHHHPNCRKTLSGSYTIALDGEVPLPTRCLEIHLASPVPPADTDLSAVTFTLRETAGQSGHYVALSHRWNPDADACRTTKENYACRVGRCNRNDCSSPPLSATFLGAAVFAYRLGIRYIWIDSLCIVQNDADDWNRESVKMADYYQYAWLTIAATTTGPRGVLGREVDVNDLPRVTRLPYHDKAGRKDGHFYLQCAGTAALNKEYKSDISRSELLSRGWVYQEWLLSRRIVSFSSRGVFLQCKSEVPKTPDGDFVSDNPYEDESLMEPQGFVDFGYDKNLTAKLGGDSRARVLKKWEIIISTFSGLGLTLLSQDRLVALAGIAREFGRALQALEDQKKGGAEGGDSGNGSRNYICGLWYGDVRGLSWEQSEPATPRRIPGIPTWSWASLASCTVQDGQNDENGDDGEDDWGDEFDDDWENDENREVGGNDGNDGNDGDDEDDGDWEYYEDNEDDENGEDAEEDESSEDDEDKEEEKLGGMRVQWATHRPQSQVLDEEELPKPATWNGLVPAISTLISRVRKFSDGGELSGVYSVCEYKGWRTIPVEGSTWQPRFHDSAQYRPEDIYGNENRFVALNLAGRMTPIYVDLHFTSKKDTDVAATMTSHWPDFGREMWRRVSLSSEREHIDGWASIEHPGYQTDEACVDGGPIHAFFLTRLYRVEGGYGLGNLTGFQTAFKVLFLVSVERPGVGACFERVGTGRVFGNRSLAEFEGQEEKSIWLV